MQGTTKVNVQGATHANVRGTIDANTHAGALPHGTCTSDDTALS